MLLLLLFVPFLLLPAYADNSEVTITPTPGSGAPGCEDTAEGCFLPNIVIVDVGGTVIFTNTDNAAHTFTSGDPTMPDTVQVLFDSGLVMAGGSFEWTTSEAGDVPYFCMVHPWRDGMIIVEDTGELDAQYMVINEVDINPPGDDSASISEWVELYNPTDSVIDLGGWEIASTTALKKTMTLPIGLAIGPGVFVTYSYDTDWFTDVNESVELRNVNGNVIDKTPIISDLQNDFTSWQRNYDGLDTNSSSDWKFVTSTAGSSNGKLDAQYMTVSVEQGENIPGVGDTIIIKVFGAKQNVVIEIVSESGEVIGEFDGVITRAGTIDQLWPIPKETEPGTYTIKVTTPTDSAETEFTYTPNVNNAGLSLYAIIIENDSSMFEVTGITDEVSRDITVSVTAPNGNVVTIVQITPMLDGTFSLLLDYTGAMWKYDGTYTIIAKQFDNPSYTDSVEFEKTGGVSYEPNYTTPQPIDSETTPELNDKDSKKFEKMIQRWNAILSNLERNIDRQEDRGNFEKSEYLKFKASIYESLIDHLENLIG